MGLPDWYGTVAVAVALVALVGLSIHLAYSARRHQRFHDARTSRGLVVALVLWVVALGSLVSAAGLMVESGGAVWSLSGMSLARGALAVGGIMLLVLDRCEETNG